jgi:hypothetical protein
MVTADDLRFLMDKEQFQIIAKYKSDFMLLKHSEEQEARNTLLEYAQRSKDIDLAKELHYLIARDFGSLEDALQWLILESAAPDSSEILLRSTVLQNSFVNPVDSLVFAHYISSGGEDDILTLIQNLPEYNGIIEATAKSVMDEISTQASSYDALELIASFEQSYPNSMWHQAAYYYELYHLAKLGDYEKLFQVMDDKRYRSAAHAYISSLYILGPSFRRESLGIRPNEDQLQYARECLQFAKSSDSANILFDTYEGADWQNRIKLQIAKASYYKMIAALSRFGDEPDNVAILPKTMRKHTPLSDLFEGISFSNNDRGEQAELYFWQGRYLSLFDDAAKLKEAIRQYGECLILGAPRKRYDADAQQAIAAILEARKINKDPLSYLREVFGYQGITFEDTHSFDDKRFTRVALADYDNDGLIDILFNGEYIYKNLGDFSFAAHRDTIMSQTLNSNGGLWADFNLDGRLDFISISHSADDNGDALMKQNPDSTFVKVNAKAGDINDKMPTEGIALVDNDRDGFPSLYMANYEKWQSRSGYPDAFWKNTGGSFTNLADSLGFLLPEYTDNPGLAGRGVAPADFDNDGKQEILVTNYRLNRNYLFKEADGLYMDVAALYGITGTYKNGYYGHSIGADWGDFDNDGDLDLIIANLAHPRFIDISDKTMLLRNDGIQSRVVAADTLYFYQFTDITAKSGISYDELHAEPLFFDADNDGWLDIYITSVYENDRSYLYHNNGDGSFTDISYLSGSRIYNGWSCATGDLNNDGLLDLVLGSGNNTKVLSNISVTANKALYLQAIWKSDSVQLKEVDVTHPQEPNSPAFGTRVIVKLKNAEGKTINLMRELSSAKGSSTQNAPVLHFGLANHKLIDYQIWSVEQ